MSESTSTKPYLIRALYEWCSDNGYTPHLAVKVLGQVRVPMEFVRNGDIVLNIAFTATSDLHMDNQAITFKARFGGVASEIYVPIEAVSAIYASENGQGMAFDVIADLAASQELKQDAETEKSGFSLSSVSSDSTKDSDETKPKENRKKPSLTVIK